MEYNVLHVISKLQYVKLHVVKSSLFYTLRTLSCPRRQPPKSGHSHLYRRWSFSAEMIPTVGLRLE